MNMLLIYVFPYCLEYRMECSREACRERREGERFDRCRHRVVREELDEQIMDE